MRAPGFPRQSVTPDCLHDSQGLPGDHPAILALVGSVELAYPAMDLSCFWVAESDGVLVAAAELKELDTCSLLSCVGVREGLRGRGIGQALVDRVARTSSYPVYLFTLVPGFFRKAGFCDAKSLPPDLPPRSIYDCSKCPNPALCVCLVRPRDGS